FQKELFAQLTRLYTTNRSTLERHLPRGYDLLRKALIQGWHAETTPMVAGSARVRREVRPHSAVVFSEGAREGRGDATTEGSDQRQPAAQAGRAAVSERGRGGELKASRAGPTNPDTAAHEAATSPKNDLPQPTAAQAE